MKVKDVVHLLIDRKELDNLDKASLDAMVEILVTAAGKYENESELTESPGAKLLYGILVHDFIVSHKALQVYINNRFEN